MKFPPFSTFLIITGLMASSASAPAQPAPAATPAPADAPGPILTFVTNEYNFGKVNMGTQVNHTYFVSNSGDAMLVISNVQPGCHCTTAKPWTREIAPGQTGEIPIKFDSGGIHGDITRTITVTSNSKKSPMQTLFLRGTIWREIEVNPQTAYMTVMPDAATPSTSVVHILNQGATPITLSEPVSATKLFKAEVKTKVPGKEFEVTITAVAPLPSGNNVGNITIKTSSTNVPEVIITALAMVQPPIGVAPMQIVLPPEITLGMTNLVTITANGSKPLTLSEPEICCDKAIKVELKEVMPGRVYHLIASFPPGFTIIPGQRAQISLKSNNAEHPEVVVPISQFPRQPAMTPQIAHPKVMSQAPPAPPATSRP